MLGTQVTARRVELLLSYDLELAGGVAPSAPARGQDGGVTGTHSPDCGGHFAGPVCVEPLLVQFTHSHTCNCVCQLRLGGGGRGEPVFVEPRSRGETHNEQVNKVRPMVGGDKCLEEG